MRLFSTEAVSKYHPDKYADQISDAILTECLKQDRQSHCGIETMVKGNTVVLGGEITSKADINYDQIVRRVAKKLGYRAIARDQPCGSLGRGHRCRRSGHHVRLRHKRNRKPSPLCL